MTIWNLVQWGTGIFVAVFLLFVGYVALDIWTREDEY